MNESATFPSLAAFGLARNLHGQLVMTLPGGVVHEGVTPVRAFPIAAPLEGLSLVGADGHELLWIDRLDQLLPRLLNVSLYGAAGTSAALGPQAGALRHAMAAELGLAAPDTPWHTTRDSIAELGRGLIRYTSDEARAIAGHRSGEIEGILGYSGRAALIHRDDMAV